VFNIDFKSNHGFKSFFESILSKVNEKGISWIKTTFSLSKNISLEISYVLISQYAYTFRAAIIENQVIVNQIFDSQSLFNALNQLELLDSFYDEVILWYLNGDNK